MGAGIISVSVSVTVELHCQYPGAISVRSLPPQLGHVIVPGAYSGPRPGCVAWAHGPERCDRQPLPALAAAISLIRYRRCLSASG